jgi:hypothetical protein
MQIKPTTPAPQFFPIKDAKGNFINALNHTFENKAAALAFADTYVDVLNKAHDLITEVSTVSSQYPNPSISQLWGLILPQLNFFITLVEQQIPPAEDLTFLEDGKVIAPPPKQIILAANESVYTRYQKQSTKSTPTSPPGL